MPRRPRARQVRMRGTIRVRTYPVLEEKVLEGVLGFLWNDEPRTPKDQADAEAQADRAVRRIMGGICECFVFDDEE